ncbi:MAG: anti-sigma F factor [Clostridia bacterium]|nr:anti-sigma F factor [Clostridia bacterium]
MTNHVKVEFEAKEINVSLARIIAAGFIAPLDPTLDEAEDVKVAISEAVTNSIVHGYEGKEGIVYLEAFSYDNTLMVSIHDNGCGIEDIAKAKEPLFTTKPQEERSGLGFTVMESFMDSLHIESKIGGGTTVTMTKRIGSRG